MRPLICIMHNGANLDFTSIILNGVTRFSMSVKGIYAAAGYLPYAASHAVESIAMFEYL